VAPVRADATLLQEAVPRPVRKKFPLVPVLLGLLAIVLLAGIVVERQPLMQLVGLKTTDSAAAPNTGGTPTPTPTPSLIPPPTQIAMVSVPNVGCMNALAAQQAIEAAGFKFVGSFLSQAGYANGIVIRTQPVANGTAPKGSDVTAFVSTGPPQGVNAINQCLLIIKRIPPDLILKYQPMATGTPTPH
jgi:hypothetical protein